MKKILAIILIYLINTIFIQANQLSEEFEDAIRNNEINKVKTLIKQGADVNQRNGDYYPIISASYGDNWEIVELLIKSGANVNIKDSDGNSALMAAVMKESVREDEDGNLINIEAYSKSLEILLKNGANPNITNKNGIPPLAYCEELPNAKLLLKYEANPNLHYMILYLLIYENNYEVAEYLLKNGAKILRDENNFPAALIASAYKENAFIDLILKQVDINSVDKYGNNILFYSAKSQSYPDYLMELIKLGANINHKNNEGETFIFESIRKYENSYGGFSAEMLKELLESGVDLTVKNKKGQNILDIAKKNETKELLNKYMINYNKFSKITADYSKNKNIKETISSFERENIMSVIKYKPKYFTDGQYIQLLNDYAYFLSETERYKEAIPILERVIILSRDRAVAYLNLGDCYYKEYKKSKKQSELDKVIENYRKYLSLLKKGAKIPERVKEMVNYKYQKHDDENHIAVNLGNHIFNLTSYYIDSYEKTNEIEKYTCQINKGSFSKLEKFYMTVKQIENPKVTSIESILGYINNKYKQYNSLSIYLNIVGDSKIKTLFIIRNEKITYYIVAYNDSCYLIESTNNILELMLFDTYNNYKADNKPSYEIENNIVRCGKEYTAKIEKISINSEESLEYKIMQGNRLEKYSSQISKSKEGYEVLVKDIKGNVLLNLSTKEYNIDEIISFKDVNMDGFIDIVFLSEPNGWIGYYELYTWNNDKKRFEKVNGAKLSHFEVFDGYIKNWEKGGLDKKVQIFNWEANSLVKLSEKEITTDK